MNTFLLMPVTAATSSGELLSCRGKVPPASSMRSASRILHLIESLPLQADVDSALLRDAVHISFESVADVYRAEQLVVVQYAPMAVFDDDPVTDRNAAGHQDIHPLPWTDGNGFVGDKAVEFRGGDYPTRKVVAVDEYHVSLARFHSEGLVGVGYEEVLGRYSPCEECAVQVLVHHFEKSRFARSCIGAFGRGGQPVFGIVIDEHLFRVANSVSERHVAVGKQHFVAFLVREVESVIGYSVYRQCVVASRLQHD